MWRCLQIICSSDTADYLPRKLHSDCAELSWDWMLDLWSFGQNLSSKCATHLAEICGTECTHIDYLSGAESCCLRVSHKPPHRDYDVPEGVWTGWWLHKLRRVTGVMISSHNQASHPLFRLIVVRTFVHFFL